MPLPFLPYLSTFGPLSIASFTHWDAAFAHWVLIFTYLGAYYAFFLFFCPFGLYLQLDSGKILHPDQLTIPALCGPLGSISISFEQIWSHLLVAIALLGKSTCLCALVSSAVSRSFPFWLSFLSGRPNPPFGSSVHFFLPILIMFPQRFSLIPLFIAD